MGKNVKENLVLNSSINFAFKEKTEVLFEQLNDSYTFFDARMAMVSYQTDHTGLDWYLNYINTAAYFARKNPKAYSSYMLQLGYVPVVYMPSCAGLDGVKYMSILDNSGIPYVRMKATSFVIPYFSSDMVDAWCSKLVLGDYMHCKPEDVRSADVIRRLFAQ